MPARLSQQARLTRVGTSCRRKSLSSASDRLGSRGTRSPSRRGPAVRQTGSPTRPSPGPLPGSARDVTDRLFGQCRARASVWRRKRSQWLRMASSRSDGRKTEHLDPSNHTATPCPCDRTLPEEPNADLQTTTRGLRDGLRGPGNDLRADRRYGGNHVAASRPAFVLAERARWHRPVNLATADRRAEEAARRAGRRFAPSHAAAPTQRDRHCQAGGVRKPWRDRAFGREATASCDHRLPFDRAGPASP